jgi:HNH endonuclease
LTQSYDRCPNCLGTKTVISVLCLSCHTINRREERAQLLTTQTKKLCRPCGRVLPLSAFGRKTKSWDGLRSNCRECAKKDAKRRRESDPDRFRAIAREYARTHRDEARVRHREWTEKNREHVRAKARLIARKRKLDHESYEYAIILIGDPCSYCGRPAEAVDHITAVAKSGPNHWTNLTASCKSCNSKKRTRSLLGFLAWEGR